MHTPIRKRSARAPVSRHRIRERIQNMILSGKRRPGTKLVQEDLARELGVSRIVVREALLELKSLGLVETVDNRGMYVGQIDASRLMQSFDVREVLEGLSARLCCGRIGPAQTKALRAMADRIRRHARDRRFDEMAALDREFHARLMQLSGNEMLQQLAGRFRWVGKMVSIRSDYERTHMVHCAILRAITRNQPGTAERLMRQHIRAGKGQLERHLEQSPLAINWT